MLTVKDLNGNEAPLTDHSEITKNEKLNEVDQIEFDAYDFSESTIAFNMITERSQIQLPNDGQLYRVLSREIEVTNDVRVMHITALHIIHDLTEHYIAPAQIDDDLAIDDKTTITMSLDDFMRYITKDTNFTYEIEINDDFGTHDFDEYPSGRVDDLFLNQGREAFGYEFTADNYHIYLSKRIGKGDSFIFVDKTNVANIHSTYDDSTITTHIEGRSTYRPPVDNDNGVPVETYGICSIENIEGAKPYIDVDGKPSEQQEDRVLDLGSAWKIDEYLHGKSHTWYRVSDHEWLLDSDVGFDKAGDVPIEEHVVKSVRGQGTLKSSNEGITTSTGNAACTVSNVAGYANVYNAPDGWKTGRTLAQGTSWAVQWQCIMNGKTWYQVGLNEWLSADDVSFDKSGDVKPESHLMYLVSGTGHIKIDSTGSDDNSNSNTSVDVYNSPWTPQYVVNHLANGTAWKIDEKVDNGAQNKTWYRVADNQWVTSDSFDFSNVMDLEPVDVNSGVAANGVVAVYDSPWTPQNQIRTLPNGSRWKIDEKVESGARNKTWYRVATNQWVDSSDFDFSAFNDVDPVEIDANADVKDVYASYTSPNANSYGIVDADFYESTTAKTPEDLVAEMKAKIQDYPLMQLTLDYYAFEDNVIGDNNSVGLGNSGWIRDRHGIDLSSRIIELTTYLQSPTNQEPTIVFGNITSDLATTLAQLSGAQASANNISSVLPSIANTAISDFFGKAKWTEEDVNKNGRT